MPPIAVGCIAAHSALHTRARHRQSAARTHQAALGCAVGCDQVLENRVVVAELALIYRSAARRVQRNTDASTRERLPSCRGKSAERAQPRSRARGTNSLLCRGLGARESGPVTGVPELAATLKQREDHEREEYKPIVHFLLAPHRALLLVARLRLRLQIL